MPATILVVEDDSTFATLIEDSLKGDGHVVARAATCEEGWRYFESLRPALVVADVGLPDESGLALCRRIRAHPTLSNTPIVVLTAKGKLHDKTHGFEAGADHYLVKPLQIEELRLWVGALLRRVNFAEKEGGLLKAPDFVIDPQTHTVTAGERVIRDLTRKEFDLLYELVRHQPKVLSKDFILSRLWGAVLRDNTVEVHIRNIRVKLGPDAAARIINVPRVGYRFE